MVVRAPPNVITTGIVAWGNGLGGRSAIVAAETCAFGSSQTTMAPILLREYAIRTRRRRC